ncbi:hypothetical protein OQA88_8630 [Cercophora sp. LCS_1]
MAGIAATWTMPNVGKVSPMAGTDNFTLEATNESVMSPDLRSRVDPRDFADGGKYRSIVKLIIRYEGQTDKGHAMGTGWLIRPDLMVTAGHNVLDWSGGGRGYGKAVQIKCYIGYRGAASVDTPGVQFRLAKNIVTTAEWLMSRENRHRDVAFIQVDRPFDGDLRLFSYKSTPATGHVTLGVVGYPGDKVLETDSGEERGAEMYEMFNARKYDLAKAPLKLLEYDVSTYGGQSGAPVIRKDSRTQTVIGTHVYGAGVRNQASTIGLSNGNDYDALIKAFSAQFPVVSESVQNGIKVKMVRHAQASVSTTSPSQPSTGLTGGHAGEEGFFDVFKNVSQFVGGTLPTIAPFLGPVGGPLAAVAGTAMSALAGRAESAFDDPQGDGQAAADRAVLAEAALQTVLKMEDGPALSKVVAHMEECYRTNAPNTKAIAPKIAPVLLDTASRINTDNGYNKVNSHPRVTLAPHRLRTDGSESAFGTTDFVAGLLQHNARPLVGEEGFFDGLGSFINSGFKVARPLLREGSKVSLGLLSNTLAAESAWESAGVDSETIKAAELVTQRALLGEAALQAFDKLNNRDLSAVRVSQDPLAPVEEGFFGSFLSAAQKIGGVVKEATPGVIKTVLPIAVNRLEGEAGQQGADALLAPAPHGLRKKKLLCAELLDGGSLHNLSL